MTDGIKIEWEEPGPADKCRMTVVHGPQHTVEYRDPTEADLTRALELLAPEVRGRVIAKWRMRVDSQEAGEEIRDLKNRLALSERQVTIATASAYAARSPDHIVAAMREMPADVLERVLAPFAHEKGTILVERRAAEVRAEKAERERDELRAKLAATEKERDEYHRYWSATGKRANAAEEETMSVRARLALAGTERDAAIAKLEAVRRAAG